MNFLIFVISIGGLIWGTRIIIIQSAKVALKLNIPEFIIGATLIAFATSLPEMIIGITASYYHKGDIVIGNSIGSNILNITLILGTLFIISAKINLQNHFFVKSATLLIMSMFILILMLLDNILSTLDSILLITFIFSYLLFLLQEYKNRPYTDFSRLKNSTFTWSRILVSIIFSFLLISFGGYLTIDSASQIGVKFGISEWDIGILLIALSSSLPELILTILASIKGKIEMAIGNIIGSNIANLTIVIGLSGLINPIKSNISLHFFDIFTLIITSLLLLIIIMNKDYSKSIGIGLFIILGIFINNKIEYLPF